MDIAFFAFMGEVLAVGAALTRLKIKQGVSLLVSIKTLSIPALALLSAVAVVQLGLPSGWIASIVATAAIILVYLGGGIAAFGLIPEILQLMGRNGLVAERIGSSSTGRDGR